MQTRIRLGLGSKLKNFCLEEILLVDDAPDEAAPAVVVPRCVADCEGSPALYVGAYRYKDEKIDWWPLCHDCLIKDVGWLRAEIIRSQLCV